MGILGLTFGGKSKKVKPARDVVPPGVVIFTAPVEPEPTTATMAVDESTMKEATGVPPNVIMEVPVKFVPVIVITEPAPALVGEKEVIVGVGMVEGGIKINPASDALPPGVVRLTEPLAPAPTTATIEVEETTVKDVTGVPPRVMADVLLKFVPVILMVAPAAAVVGANVVIVGAPMNVKPASDALPPGVVRLTAPLLPAPTLATIDVEETTVKEVTAVPPSVMADV